MPTPSLRPALALIAPIALPMLMGCGGGGGGAGNFATSAPGFTGNADLPDTGSVVAEGEAVIARFVTDPVSGAAEITDIAGEIPGQLLLVTENGEVVAIDLTAEGANAGFDSRGDVVLQSDPGAAALEFVSVDEDRFAIFINPTSGTFNHQVLGVWATGLETGAGSAAAGAFGATTPVANLPTGVIARYDGAVIGFLRTADGSVDATVAPMIVETDFTIAAIQTALTQVTDLAGGNSRAAPELDFSGTGPVSGGRFTASISDGSAMTGTAHGGFNGPNAEEVAGTYRMTGPDGAAHIGAFGGSQ